MAQDQCLSLNISKRSTPSHVSKKKVYVCGRGAVGLTLGDQLANHLDNFSFIVDKDRKNRYINQTVKVNGKPISYCYLSGEDSTDQNTADLVFFACKFYDLNKAMDDAAPFIGPRTILMSGINGVESEACLQKRFPESPIVHTIAQNMDSVYDSKKQELHFTTPGEIVFGFAQDSLKCYADQVEELFLACEVPYIYSSDILLDQYRKLMFNCGINQVCAAFDVTYGEVAKNPKLLALFRQAMEEARIVIAAVGKDPGKEALENWVQKISTFSYDSLPSMAQDLRAGRWVELELFAGTIISMAATTGIEIPVTTELAQRILEKRYKITKENEENLAKLYSTGIAPLFKKELLFPPKIYSHLNTALQWLDDLEKSASLNKEESSFDFLFKKLGQEIEGINIQSEKLLEKIEHFQQVAQKTFEELKTSFRLLETQIRELISLQLLDPYEAIFGKDYEYSEDFFFTKEYNLIPISEISKYRLSIWEVCHQFSKSFVFISEWLEKIKRHLNVIQKLLEKINISFTGIKTQEKRNIKTLASFEEFLSLLKRDINSLKQKISECSEDVCEEGRTLEKILESFYLASIELNKRTVSLPQNYSFVLRELVKS